MTLLSREALFNLVWTQPVKGLAVSFGISDVGLRKICQGIDIPLPERGYWAKLRAGKAPPRPKLPPRGAAMPHTVGLGSRGAHRSYWPCSIENLEAELATPLPEPPVFEEPIDDVRARVEEKVGKVRFERSLNAGHGLIRNLLDKDEARRPQPGDPSWRLAFTKPIFDSGFERHRLRILSSLFLALQKYGARPLMRGESARELGVSVGVETVRFTLDHPNAKVDRNGDWKTWSGTIDVMRLCVAGAGGRVWVDTEEDRLEHHLEEVVVHLIVAGEMNYRARELGSLERAVDRRREAQEELEKLRAEAKRKARAARIAEEGERRKALVGMAADLRAAEDIRTLVRRVAEARSDRPSEPVQAWSRWALTVADRLDPTARLRFEADGSGRLQSPDWAEPIDASPRRLEDAEDGRIESSGGCDVGR